MAPVVKAAAGPPGRHSTGPPQRPPRTDARQAAPPVTTC